MPGRPWIARWFGKRNDKGESAADADMQGRRSQETAVTPAEGASAEANLYFRHWQSLQADGIAASRFIEYLQPHADLEAVSVFDLEVTEVTGTPTAYGLPTRKR